MCPLAQGPAMTWQGWPTQFLSPWWALALVSTVLGCATLPDSAALIAQHSEQAAQFQGARGPLSARKNAAISTELKRKSGDLNMLDLQISLEQAISASPMTLGNKVSLLETPWPPKAHGCSITAITARCCWWTGAS